MQSSWQLSGVHHIGLTVSDLPRSIAFYRDLLGLHLVRQRTTSADYIGQQTGFPGVELQVASFKVNLESRLSIEVVQYITHAGVASDPATNRAGNSHLCLEVNDIHRAYEMLQARGVRFRTPPVAITSGPNQGGFGVYLLDPDGYTIELFQPPSESAT